LPRLIKARGANAAQTFLGRIILSIVQLCATPANVHRIISTAELTEIAFPSKIVAA
jgi:hypothetical protein